MGIMKQKRLVSFPIWPKGKKHLARSGQFYPSFKALCYLALRQKTVKRALLNALGSFRAHFLIGKGKSISLVK